MKSFDDEKPITDETVAASKTVAVEAIADYVLQFMISSHAGSMSGDGKMDLMQDELKTLIQEAMIHLSDKCLKRVSDLGGPSFTTNDLISSRDSKKH
jgi:hypothetical protein